MQKSDDSSVRLRLDRANLVSGLSAAAMVMSPVVTNAATDRPAAFALAGGSLRAAPAMLIGPITEQESTVAANVRFRLDDKEWSEAEQKRFEELAIADAVGELTKDEALELESLQASRRAHLQPRSGDEVLWEFEQRRLTSNLLETLRQYVEFYEGANPAWFATSQNSD